MGRKINMNINKSNRSYKQVEREFLKHCRVKNLTEKTLTYYEESLEEFIKFYGTEQFKIQSITQEIIENYIMHLRSKGKKISINTRIRGIRAFLYWCMERGYLEQFKIKLIKQEDEYLFCNLYGKKLTANACKIAIIRIFFI